jgi:hypothetical protein
MLTGDVTAVANGNVTRYGYTLRVEVYLETGCILDTCRIAGFKCKC